LSQDIHSDITASTPREAFSYFNLKKNLEYISSSVRSSLFEFRAEEDED